MKAVIVAGGKGMRLSSVLQDIPKPMVCINNKPILEYQILNLMRYGITDIVIVIGYRGDAIKEYFGDGNRLGVSITYYKEENPLGTAGALYYLKNILEEDFILVFGDLLFDINWTSFIEEHLKSDALVTIYAHPNDHPNDSDLLIVDNGTVKQILSKNGIRLGYFNNLVSAGLYCIKSCFIDEITEGYCDLEKDLIRKYLDTDRINVYQSFEYVKDIGTPNRLDRARTDYNNGIVSAKNSSKKQKAIFLDRDGTINVHKGYIRSENELELIDKAAQAIRLINLSSYLAIVVTNQPVIARGEVTLDGLNSIHSKLQTELGRDGAYIDDLFYCPHHPDRGFVGERVQYKIECNCRKPNIGMINGATEKYNIDIRKSWIIGDTITDIKTGKNSGLKTILIQKNTQVFEPADEKPDYVVQDLHEAVKLILKIEQ